MTLDKIADTVNCHFAPYRLEEKQLIIDFKLIAPREFLAFMCMHTSTHYTTKEG